MQTFNLEVVSNANGTIVSQAMSYWQTLAPNGGGIAVGLIVEVQLFAFTFSPERDPVRDLFLDNCPDIMSNVKAPL